jgi:ribosome-binding factor A
MAQGRRVERVAALIRREMSELLRSGIRDERVHHGMVSVTEVEVAGDLQHCRIHVSVFGTEDDQRLTMEGLKAAAPYVKGELARRLQMRRTPEVVFLLDRALARGTSVLGLLNQLERKREERSEIPPGSDEDEVDAAIGPVGEIAGEGPQGRDATGTRDPDRVEVEGAPPARVDGTATGVDDGPSGPFSPSALA